MYVTNSAAIGEIKMNNDPMLRCLKVAVYAQIGIFIFAILYSIVSYLADNISEKSYSAKMKQLSKEAQNVEIQKLP